MSSRRNRRFINKDKKIDKVKVTIGDPNLPNLDLTIDHLFCKRHGEPFRQAVISQEGFSQSLQFVTACLLKWLENNKEMWDEADGKESNVPKCLENKPFCCRLTKGQLVDLYIQSGIGRIGACEHCHRIGLGIAYRCKTPTYLIRTYSHINFVCLVETSYDHVLGMKVTGYEQQ